MLPLPNGILDVGVHYYFLVLLCLVVIIYRIGTALLGVGVVLYSGLYVINRIAS